MPSFRCRLPQLLSLLLFASASLHAGTLTGTVVNRTTGKPQPNVALDFLSPTAGMAEVATATSDANGHFSVTKDAIGLGPILIRATYHDTSFNTFAPPGRPTVDVDIFDISQDPKTISVPSHVIIFEPRENSLVGAEEYSVQNSSEPPVAYFRTAGNFEFAIPEQARLQQVSTVGAMGMSVAQASIDKGKGRFAIAYPFRPGQTNVRLSYEVAYANNAASVSLPNSYPGAKILVVVPPGVSITGEGLLAAGQEQGMMVYTHDPMPTKAVLTVNLSGAPTAPPAGVGEGQPQAQEGNSRQGGAEVIAAPARLDGFKWYIFGGLLALFAMGAMMLASKKVVVPALETADDSRVKNSASPLSQNSSVSSPAPKAPSAPVVPPSPSSVSAQVDRQVAQTMEGLKEQIFRLELRRQAGTISEGDYHLEKSRIDQLLRDLVQG